MNLLVTGSRKITNPDIIKIIFDYLALKPNVLIHGGASGVDTLSTNYFQHQIWVEETLTIGSKSQDHIRRELGRLENQAKQKGMMNNLVVRPRYDHTNDRAAPIRRNIEMVKLLNPDVDIAVAIWDGESAGTLKTINKLLDNNIQTYIFTVRI